MKSKRILHAFHYEPYTSRLPCDNKQMKSVNFLAGFPAAEKHCLFPPFKTDYVNGLRNLDSD